jgi:RND family efflux transporter MFP subunit
MNCVAKLLYPLALLGFISGCGRGTAPAPAPSTVDLVVAEPITKRIVEWDEYTGRLEAIEFVEIRARVGGYLQEIHFTEGQIVKKDDLLCVIDPRLYAAAVRRAEAALREARANEGRSKTEVVRTAAEKKEAEAKLALEEQRFRRAQDLVSTSAISKEEFDIRESTVLQARALIESADANIATAEAAVTVATAGVGAAEASLESAKINLDYTEVRAPTGGRVSRRFVDRGNLISGGTADSTLLTTIVSLDPIHVSFDADEAAFLKYERLKAEGKRGSSRDVKNPVYLALADERPAFPHQGHMDFVDNRMDPNTGTMRGRAILRNPEFILTPGLFARVRLPGSGAYDAVLIPDAAVVSDQSERFVYVVEADGAIRRQVVEMGPVVQGLRVVRKGLSGAEKIVVRGLQRVRPGLKAKVTLEKLVLKNDEGLPDHYEPVPQEDWIPREISYLPPTPARRTARTVSLMHMTAASP